MKPHSKPISLFFLVWWAAGAVLNTFEKPFETTYANGYFGCWAAIFASALFVDTSWGLSLSANALNHASEAIGGAPQELLVLLLASVVCLAAAAIDCGQDDCDGLEFWAIICSMGSVSGCFFAVTHVLRGGLIIDGTAVQRVASVLLCWWVVGVGCMTFVGPFWRLGNGYFASWVSFAAAGSFATKHVEVLKSAREDDGTNTRQMYLILTASLVLLLQAIWDLVRGVAGTEGRAWVIMCSFISFVVCLAVKLQFEKVRGYFKWAVLGLLIWWSIGLATMTFSGAYVRTGNGYFSCWTAWLASGSLLLKQFPQLAGYIDLTDATEPEGTSSVGKASEATPTVIGLEAEATNNTDPGDVFVVDTEPPSFDGTGVAGDSYGGADDSFVHASSIDLSLAGNSGSNSLGGSCIDMSQHGRP